MYLPGSCNAIILLCPLPHDQVSQRPACDHCHQYDNSQTKQSRQGKFCPWYARATSLRGTSSHAGDVNCSLARLSVRGGGGG